MSDPIFEKALEHMMKIEEQEEITPQNVSGILFDEIFNDERAERFIAALKKGDRELAKSLLQDTALFSPDQDVMDKDLDNVIKDYELDEVLGLSKSGSESKVEEQDEIQPDDARRPRVKKGDKIEVYDYRGSKTSTVTVIDNPLYQDEEWQVAIQYDNGDKHYGVWDEKEQRWESGAGFYESKEVKMDEESKTEESKVKEEVEEGKVPDDKDSEETKIKKLTEDENEPAPEPEPEKVEEPVKEEPVVEPEKVEEPVESKKVEERTPSLFENPLDLIVDHIEQEAVGERISMDTVVRIIAEHDSDVLEAILGLATERGIEIDGFTESKTKE